MERARRFVHSWGLDRRCCINSHSTRLNGAFWMKDQRNMTLIVPVSSNAVNDLDSD